MNKTNPDSLVASLKSGKSGISRLDALASLPKEHVIPNAATEVPKTLPLDAIHSPSGARNARKFYFEEEIEKRAQQLREHGQIVPVNVYLDEHGKWTLEDGNYRLKAARRAGLAELTVNVVDRPLDTMSAFLRSRQANVERSEQSALDDAFKMKELIESGETTQRRLAEALAIDESELSKLLRLTALPDSVIGVVHSSKSFMSKRFLYNLALFYDKTSESDTLRLLADASVKGMSARELEQRVNAVSKDRETRKRATRIPIDRDNGMSGYIKSFDSGRIEVRLDGVPQDQINALLRQLESMLAHT